MCGIIACILLFTSAGRSEPNNSQSDIPAEDQADAQSEAPLSNLSFPILLVDGLSRRSDVDLIATFAEEREHLSELGADAFISSRDAFGSIQSNAALLAQDIDRILSETGSSKVYIIAHSKGGLDSRYLISKLEYGDRVAALATIATPHRGTWIADTIAENVGNAEELVARVVDWFARFIGDSSPDSEMAADQLTRQYMAEFNEEVLDHPSVRYVSYASSITEEYPNPLWARVALAFSEEEGANDGLVSVSSAQWGDFRGIVNEIYGYEQVSHQDVVGMNDFWNNMGFPYLEFIVDVVLELEEGYTSR